MYKFKLEQVLNERFLTKLVSKFRNNEVLKYEKLDRYYMSENDAIKLRSVATGKPNNKIAHGFARYITNMATSYFLGKPIKFHTDDENFNEVLSSYMEGIYNINYDISKAASKKGVSFEILYINENGKLKSKKYEGEEWIPIYSSRPDEFLECAVHIWEVKDIDGNLLFDYADVYDKASIWHFVRRNKSAVYDLIDIESHYLSDVPLIVYANNEEMLGDYETAISIIDAYDRAQSDTANDMDYFTDAYLTIVGAGGGFTDANGNELSTEESQKSLRNNRVIFLDEKGSASFLTKNSNDASNENYKNRLFKDLFFICQVPAMTDESFAGDLSGIAIRYKLIGLEQLAIMKENKFRLALAKKLRIITDFINIRERKSFDAGSIKQVYERNFVDNTKEMIENTAKLEGIVSKETQLNTLPASIVDNAKEEILRIEEETKRNEGLFLESEREDE